MQWGSNFEFCSYQTVSSLTIIGRQEARPLLFYFDLGLILVLQDCIFFYYSIPLVLDLNGSRSGF
jgi:hypothetical protein